MPRMSSSWARLSDIPPSGGRALSAKEASTYTDGDRKKADEARGYFERAGVSGEINVKIGDALELLSEEKRNSTSSSNDVDKEDYPRVVKLALPRLRKGGLFVTDNVLWSGKVAQKDPPEALDQSHSGI